MTPSYNKGKGPEKANTSPPGARQQDEVDRVGHADGTTGEIHRPNLEGQWNSTKEQTVWCDRSKGFEKQFQTQIHRRTGQGRLNGRQLQRFALEGKGDLTFRQTLVIKANRKRQRGADWLIP